ncbi:amidohydrolase [Marinoscillum sp. MHG1-6]|uniref:amidohydrolase family protein n=1 Tax=Marinoscillum sp. MHG1-6 TaxID=2959627 RepID=UPI002157DA48|nr:amidohydrolase [Marinoscillum sp. MHG1-6]
MNPKIIDTHIHIWELETIQYRWLEGNTTILNQTYNLDQLEETRQAAGITAGVLVQAENHFEDTNWMLLNAAQHSWIKGVVGWVPLLDPQRTSDALDRFLKNDHFKGVRHLIHDEKDPRWLLQPKVIESLKILAERGVPYDVVGVLPKHIQSALEVAEKVPGLKMVFDHLNQPPIPSKEMFGPWGELMKEAAGHPMFYQKISGQGTASGNFNSWSVDDIRPYVEFVLDHFGTDRCFLGGDWPVSLLAGDYVRTWSVYKELLNDLLTNADLEKVYSQNAVNFYNLEA